MKSKITKLIIILTILSVPVLQSAAEQIELTELVKAALEENVDIITASLDLKSEELKYESVKSGNLPSLAFTTDTGNNSLYKYSDGNEFSPSTYTSSRFKHHKIGGGLNLGIVIPTGGSLNLTGTGSLDLSQAEDADSWEYLVNPALSLYLRQPLFTDSLNGSALRFDSMKLANELAGIGVSQAELSRTAVENNLIIAIARTAMIFNNLGNTYELLKERLELAEKRLKLSLQDEQAGRISSLDRLSEELLIKRQEEALIEIGFQIESTRIDLEQLTGLSQIPAGGIALTWRQDAPVSDVDHLNSFGVLSSGAVMRSIELAGSVVPDGSEPVFEISGLLRRSDQDSTDKIGTAFDDVLSAGMDLSLTLAFSFVALDWGEAREKDEAEKASLMAAEKRLEAAEKAARTQTAAALRNLKLIEEKFVLLKRGYEYDDSILRREQQRFEAGLTSEVALETIRLDRKDREYQIRQLNDEKSLALLELYHTGGVELKRLFR